LMLTHLIKCMLGKSGRRILTKIPALESDEIRTVGVIINRY